MDILPVVTAAPSLTTAGSPPQPGDTSPADDPFVAMLAGLLASTVPTPAPPEVVACAADGAARPVDAPTLSPAGQCLLVDGADQSCPAAPPGTAPAAAAMPPAVAGLAPPATGSRPEPTPGRADAKPMPKDERQAISVGPRRSGKADTVEAAPSAAAVAGTHSGPAAFANGSSAQPEWQPTAPSAHAAGPAESASPAGFVPVEAAAARASAVAQAPIASPGQQSQAGQPTPLLLPDHLGRPVTARVVVAGPGDHQRLRIELDPADLGRVEVDLRLGHGGAAAAVFTVDRAETLMLLQRDARTVTDMLTSAGFTVDQGDLGFTLRDNGGGGSRPQTSLEEPVPRAQRHENGALQALPPPIWVPRGLLDLHV